jgi:hypothetical protein
VGSGVPVFRIKNLLFCHPEDAGRTDSERELWIVKDGLPTGAAGDVQVQLARAVCAGSWQPAAGDAAQAPSPAQALLSCADSNWSWTALAGLELVLDDSRDPAAPGVVVLLRGADGASDERARQQRLLAAAPTLTHSWW